MEISSRSSDRQEQHLPPDEHGWNAMVQVPEQTARSCSAPRCSAPPHRPICCPFTNKALSVVPPLISPSRTENDGRNKSKCVPFPQCYVHAHASVGHCDLGLRDPAKAKQQQDALFTDFSLCPKSSPSCAALKWHPQKKSDIKLPPQGKEREKKMNKKEKGNRRAGVSMAKDSIEERTRGGG